MLKRFLRRSQKIQGKENYTVATLWKPIRSGLDRLFSGSLQREQFSLFGISIQAGKRSSRSITKRSCATGLIFFTKHKRPISSEDLEVLYAANQLGLNVLQIRHGLTPFSTSEREAVKTNAIWYPVTFSSKQRHAGWSTSSQARERRKICPPSSAPDHTHSVFHGCKFFLVKFLNSTSEYMNQKRQVFEFLIQGALRKSGFLTVFMSSLILRNEN